MRRYHYTFIYIIYPTPSVGMLSFMQDLSVQARPVFVQATFPNIRPASDVHSQLVGMGEFVDECLEDLRVRALYSLYDFFIR